ncbi:hypothetical protein LCGC14_2799000 [marine sediment metagenome]|uniref:Uncharacterized protein n=1 Tax=marine sediment metagenome TaxID=412755 RepID=A0A0F8YNF3_9ZZZZ
MASEQDQLCITLKSEADFRNFQYRAVKMTNEGYGTMALATADVLLGILQNKPAAYGRSMKVCIAGHTKAVAGDATVGAGEYVGLFPGGPGCLAQAPYGLTKILGVALTTASGTGALFEMAIEKWVYYDDT